jgi:hypothetical protein
MKAAVSPAHDGAVTTGRQFAGVGGSSAPGWSPTTAASWPEPAHTSSLVHFDEHGWRLRAWMRVSAVHLAPELSQKFGDCDLG